MYTGSCVTTIKAVKAQLLSLSKLSQIYSSVTTALFKGEVTRMIAKQSNISKQVIDLKAQENQSIK